MSNQIAKLLDFEVERGRRTINLLDVRRILNYFEYGKQERIYLLLLFLSLRPSEPLFLKWENFNNGMLIFRPPKQSKRNLIRKIKIPNKIWDEIVYYRDHNFFPFPLKLFPTWKENTMRDKLKKLRHNIGGDWAVKSGNLRGGTVAEFYKYTLYCFRTTKITLVYYYYSQAYGHGNLALTHTCDWAGHSAEKMTAKYYIKRIDQLGLEHFPNLPLLDLIDYTVYNDIQAKLSHYTEQSIIPMFEA